VLLLICGSTAIVVSLRASDAQRWVAHTLEVEQIAQQAFGLLRDPESGERGYVITNNTSYLELYEAAENALPVALQRLRQLTSDNRDQQNNLDALETLIERRLNRLRRGLEYFQKQHQIQVVPAGKDLMNEVREQFDKFMGIENSLLEQRQSYGTSINRILLGLLTVSFLLSVGVLLLSGRFFVQYLRELQSYRSALETEEKLRRDAEATLQQSQKMEAVGQLTVWQPRRKQPDEQRPANPASDLLSQGSNEYCRQGLVAGCCCTLRKSEGCTRKEFGPLR
jgi:CHASE3 domain sensor protein